MYGSLPLRLTAVGALHTRWRLYFVCVISIHSKFLPASLRRLESQFLAARIAANAAVGVAIGPFVSHEQIELKLGWIDGLVGEYTA